MLERVENFSDCLDRKVRELSSAIERTEVLRTLTDPASSNSLVDAIARNILLEVYSYGSYIIAATCTAIGRLGHEYHRIRPLMNHLLDEVSHPEMALKGYVQLGGDEACARAQRPSPAAFAVGAVTAMLARQPSPFSYLGYMYLLEGTTAILAPHFVAALGRRGTRVEFISVHAQEDVEHSRCLREQIDLITRDHPEAADAIEYGFDCFAAVYPHPVWATALHRARQEAS
jgi:hypothetical protein